METGTAKIDIRKIVIGVSGGADSTALLLMLKQKGYILHAVHCNFHLRGEESDRDMLFTRELCKRHDIPLTEVHFDTEKYCREKRLGTEEACRKLRYSKFREIKEKLEADRIAVAHNANDQAETLLLNLMRGSGIAGLRAMKEDNGEILRPLLHTTREEILKYLKEQGEDYITDSSNSDSHYRRNFIRNEVLPLLETRWPKVVKSLCRTADIMRKEEETLNVISPEWQLRRWVFNHGANSSQIDEIFTVLAKEQRQSGKTWIVAGGRISLERNGLEFISDAEINEFEIEISKSHFDRDSSMAIFRETGNHELHTSLPPDKLIFRLVQERDRISPLGMKGTTPLSKIMKDAKLSLAQKKSLVVAIAKETGEIIWAEGLKRGRNFLAEEKEGATVYTYRITRPEKQNDLFTVS